MTKSRYHQNACFATAVAAFLVATTAHVDASSSAASSRAAVSTSMNSINSCSREQQLLSRRSRFEISSLAVSRSSSKRLGFNENEIAIITALQQLRGGSDSSEENNGDGDANTSSSSDATTGAEVDSSEDVVGENKTGGGWGGLFGKKKKSNKSTDEKDDDEENNNGSFEITMNTTPDGKSNVKVDIDTPRAIQQVAKETIDKMDNLAGSAVKQQMDENVAGTTAATTKDGNSGSVAHQVSAGGATTATTNTDVSSPTKTKSTTHISSKFPIAPSELPHFMSMSFMMFLFIYVFTTVRDTKDTLVVSNCGAEAIPFLKLYAVMPCATAFIVIYSKLSNALGKQALFYTTLIPFFVFYGVFAFVLFPNRDLLHFPLVEGGAAAVGGGGAGSAAMNLLRYWSFSLFFIVSELWASAGVPLLFWQVSLYHFLMYMICTSFVILFFH